MPTVRLKVKALENADVSYISLVNRPANRIPFRVTKAEDAQSSPDGEQSMFNLDSVVRKLDGEQATASGKVAAVVMRKADLPAYEKSLAEQGFKTDDQLEMGEGVVILKQSDFNEKDVVPVEVSEDLSILVENVKKEFEPYTQSDDFMKVIGTEGFLPSMDSATNALISTMVNVLLKSASPGDAQGKIATAINEYGSYITTMVGSIPAEAFKLDKAKAESEGEAAEPESPKNDGITAEGEAKPEADDKAEAQKEEAEPNKEAEAAPEAAEGAAVEQEPVAKADAPEDLTAVLKGFKDDVLEKLNGLSEEVGEVRKSQKELGERVDSVENVAKSAQKAVKNTVLTGSDTDEGGRPNRAKKSDDDFWGGTALDKLAG